MILAILSGTPAWAFALFAWLLWMGACQLRERHVSSIRIVFVPLLFVVWGLAGLAGSSDDGLTSWRMAAAAGMLLGLARKNRLQIDPQHGRVLRPASVMPLLRNLCIFLAHYALNVAVAMHPAQRQRLMHIDIAVSGICAGYFIGWLINFARHYRGAARASRESPYPASSAAREPAGRGTAPSSAEYRNR